MDRGSQVPSSSMAALLLFGSHNYYSKELTSLQCAVRKSSYLPRKLSTALLAQSESDIIARPTPIRSALPSCSS